MVMDNEQDVIEAVERTIGILRENLSQPMTLDELSRAASLSPRHYSRIFKQLTGRSPIDYLIAQRVSRAKQLLVSSDSSIHEIAGSIGFRDPFHFSRSFKQHTGVSPKLYMKLRRNHVRIASLQFLGELLALGIKPVGAPSQLMKCGFYRHQIEGIEHIAQTVVTPHIDRLSALKPDVIVTFNGHHYENYARIAPTLDVAWSMPFFDRFRFIADWVGKSDTAEAWVESYLRNVSENKRMLQEVIRDGHTVSFLWMRGLPATFDVYYDMGVLYRDLGLRAPEPVRRVQLRKDHMFKEVVPVSELSMHTGDYMFVVVSPDDESQAEFAALSRTSSAGA